MDFFTSCPTNVWSAPNTWSVGTHGISSTDSRSIRSNTSNATDATVIRNQTASNATGFTRTLNSANSNNALTGTVGTNSFTDQTIISIAADTFTSGYTSRNSGTTIGTATTSSSTTSNSSGDRTYTAASTYYTSSTGEFGTSTTTTVGTDGPYTTAVTTTTSSTYSIATGTATTSASTWGTTPTFITTATTQITSENTSGTITWPVDFTSQSGTATRTSHLLSPFEDTVLLQQANRNYSNYHLGDEAWIFSLTSMDATATSAFRFSEIFSSTDAKTHVISEFSKMATRTAGITEITVSINTTASTTAIVTGTTSTATGTVNTTIVQTSKNGGSWVASATTNVATETQTASVGDVSTSTSTYTTDTAGPTFTATDSFYSAQTTGYSTDSVWTSDVTTILAGFDSSYTHTRLALYGSVSTTTATESISSSTDEILTSSFITSGTSTVFVGLRPTTTTTHFPISTTTTVSLWSSRYNPEVSNYTTNATGTFVGGSARTDLSRSEQIFATYHTENRLLPEIWTFPNGSFTTPFTGGVSQVWYSAPANGFGGFGGDFTASSLPVYLSVSESIVSGGAFGTQTISATNMPSASAYSAVTFYPVRTNYTIPTPSGAIGARYLSRIDSMGQAAQVAVTWTSTTTVTTSATTQPNTATTSTAATYALYGVSEITGTFIRSDALTVNTTDSRGGLVHIGGYGAGDNALSNPWTVKLDGGFAQWTAWGETGSTGTHSTSASDGSVSFTVAGTNAIVFTAEPLYTVQWSSPGQDPFISSVAHFPS